jgi:tRNA modification GTPase
MRRRERKEIDFESDTTIAAIITPLGEGGIGAIRIAGSETFSITDKLFRPFDNSVILHRPFHMYHGYIVDSKQDIVDEVMMVEMLEGNSYTGQRQAEIFCHGGRFVLKRVIEEVFKNGARPAEPGEFTRRAFLSGRIDLTRAEAVAELIASKTEYSYNLAKNNLFGILSEKIDSVRKTAVELLADVEAALDYPDEGLGLSSQDVIAEKLTLVINHIGEIAKTYNSGRIIKEGYKVCIAGRPNAGKSSLFNLLLKLNRAIVAPTPGTTRDYLTEWIDLDGLAVSLTDTAGLRSKGGAIERAGQKSAREIITDSHLIIWIADISSKKWRQDLQEDIREYCRSAETIIVLNKIDRLPDLDPESTTSIPDIDDSIPAFLLSCKTGYGLDKLRDGLRHYVNNRLPDLTEGFLITSERHKNKLDNCLKYLKGALKDIRRGESLELIAFNLRSGINEIDEITGRIYNDEILDQIFSRFCIGK